MIIMISVIYEMESQHNSDNNPVTPQTKEKTVLDITLQFIKRALSFSGNVQKQVNSFFE